MKMILSGAMALVLGLGAAAAPAMAQKNNRVRYENNGRYYNSYAQCQAAKKKSAKDGAIVGAAAAGVGSALLGANLGEAALIAGGGALVGNQLGKTKKC
jgi:opacity protein-like surface antigen